MKKFVLLTAVTLIAVTAIGQSSPFPPWLSRLTGDVSISPSGSVQLASGTIATGDLASFSVTGANLADQPNNGTSEGAYASKVVRFIFDTASGNGAIGTHALGATLPKGAVITDSFFKIITQFTDTGAGTVALHCEDANNIYSAADITGSSANAFLQGASTGGTTSFKRDIAAACTITATVATVNQDAGKLIGWVRYVVEN